VALSPTISKKKKETTKSLKSFEKTTLQQKFKKTAAKPLQNLDRRKTKQIHLPDIRFLI